MWVDVDAEAVLLALADEGDDIVEVILVVFPTAGKLSRVSGCKLRAMFRKGTHGPACSMASQVVTRRKQVNPHHFNLFKCRSASSSSRIRPTQLKSPDFAPSQNPSSCAPGCPRGVLADEARLMPRKRTVRPSVARKCALAACK